MTGSAQVIRANSRNLPLADNSVDLVVTSPPYFALRSYQDGGEHYAGQIGDEPTPAEFVASLLEVTRECVRVLKPSGSLWVNLGDKYAGSNGQQGGGGKSTLQNPSANGRDRGNYDALKGRGFVAKGAPAKSLIGIPWRYALACIDDLGLILRAEVIWSKPNGLPESVTDRVRRSHEQWFCFEPSSGVEAVAESLPLCPLCGRPADARATLVKRLQELNGGVVAGNLPDEVGANESVQAQSTSGTDLDVGGVARSAGIPELVDGDIARGQDAANLPQDGVVAVEDEHAEMRVPVGSAGQTDGAFPVEDSGEPAEVCDCVGHPLILNDEPWIPQSLAAELMQMVADGEADPQNVADFLAGDYARSHSTWFHFTLQPRYFSAVDEIREEHEHGGQGSTKAERLANGQQVRGLMHNGAMGSDNRMAGNPLGKLPGSVWTVPTEPLRVPDHLGIDHFAAFPTEWPKRIIAGWSPAGVCVECGEGRRPVTNREASLRWPSGASEIGKDSPRSGDDRARLTLGAVTSTYTLTGYACACPEPTAPTTPAIVLDPFGGTGTTAMVAKALGRHGISVDMSADYCRLAEWRTNDRNQLAKVLGIAKAEQHDDHDSLLDLLDGGAA